MAIGELVGKPPMESSCEWFIVRLQGYVEWSSAKTVFITNPGCGLEGILIKFADARNLGEIASVSEYRIKSQNYLNNWTEKCKNSYRNKDILLSLGGSALLILRCAFPVGYRVIVENSEYSHGYD